MKRLQNLLENDQAVLTAWCGHTDRFYIETVSSCGFDAVTLDMQHGLQTETTMINGVASIAASGKPAIVRIPVGRFELASKALDVGAHAVIAPMINTLEDAEEFASFMKYPPIGERSFGPAQAVTALGCASVGEYLASADSDTLALAMIETREAVSNAEAIIDVEGIDGVLVGPSDLSISFALEAAPAPFGEATLYTIERIASLVRKKGKVAAIYCGTPETVNIAHRLGFRIIALGSDGLYISKGADTMIAGVKFKA